MIKSYKIRQLYLINVTTTHIIQSGVVWLITNIAGCNYIIVIEVAILEVNTTCIIV